MNPQESLQDSEENREAAGNSGPDNTAPDSETQSGAASAAGGRTSEEGSRATSDPAEGRDE
ncbi:hypothetical protein GGR92_003756 [Spirosoma lacussanchae]|uniref:hypothetical protein n=1 Tax=Spirosoma lacussanchae TaxID=1884249 RepID=UPI001109B51F|nr:hypothetical protein [Spirosoma lacussanchae]